MASRVNLMRLGWGYAMLGFPVWAVMLHSMPRSPAQPDLIPILIGGGVAAGVVSLAVPALYRRSKWLRARLAPATPPEPGASEQERATARKRQEARAFEVYLVTWLASLVAAAIPGMVGLMLGVLGQDLTLAHAFLLVGLVLTSVRFPSARATQKALHQTEA
jgi:hypothetical protein